MACTPCSLPPQTSCTVVLSAGVMPFIMPRMNLRFFIVTRRAKHHTMKWEIRKPLTYSFTQTSHTSKNVRVLTIPHVLNTRPPACRVHRREYFLGLYPVPSSAMSCNFSSVGRGRFCAVIGFEIAAPVQAKHPAGMVISL